MLTSGAGCGATRRLVEEHDAYASKIGARGIGELGEVGVSAAITNAIYHATGKRLRKLPVHIADPVASTAGRNRVLRSDYAF